MITIIVSIPHASLSPNGRSHWRTKARIASEARSAAHWLAKDAARKIKADLPWQAATYNIHVRFKTARFQDQDNLIASLKPTLDGMCDAIGMNDRNLTLGSYTASKDAKNSGVTITIKKA